MPRRLHCLYVVALTLAAACNVQPSGSGGAAGTGTTQSTPPAAPQTTPPPVTLDSGLAQRSDYVEVKNEVANPERGFYNVAVFGSLGTPSRRILSYRVDLAPYCNTPTFPAQFTNQLTTDFAAFRAQGRKVILRFSYSLGGVLNACKFFDAASQSIVVGHLQQLGPLFAQNADVIAFAEAGFLGRWGEWHNVADASSGPEAAGAPLLASSAQTRLAVANALLTALPAGRKVLFRTPAFHDELAAAFVGQDDKIKRLGFHNDCFLADSTDYGTYPAVGDFTQVEAGIRGYTLSSPMGGETCVPDPSTNRFGCPVAVPEMRTLRTTYVNEDYHPAAISGWKSGTQPCFGSIEQGLGYRYVVTSVGYPMTPMVPGASITLEATVKNVGFAPIYNERHARFVLTAPDNSEVALTLQSASGDDLRAWVPGSTILLKQVVKLPGTLTSGPYALHLLMPDLVPGNTTLSNNPNYAVQLASAAPGHTVNFDPATGRNPLWVSLTSAGGSLPSAGVPPPTVATRTDYVEFVNEVSNPERGFLKYWNGGAATIDTTRSLQLYKVDLSANCNTTTLPAAVASSLSADLSALRSAGVKAVLWMSYHFGTNNACPNGVDAASVATIQGHMQQLGTVLQSNGDVLPFVHAGLMGAYGTWQYSAANPNANLAVSDSNRETVLHALIGALPVSTKVLLPDPLYRARIVDASLLSTLGYQDNGFLANDYDSGTYLLSTDRGPAEASMNANTLLVPFGGECGGSQTNNRFACATAMPEMGQVRPTFLSDNNPVAATTAWQDTTGGKTACYAEIERRLGYRFVATGVSYDPGPRLGGSSVRISMSVLNTGFAPIYSHFTASFVVQDDAGNAIPVSVTTSDFSDMRTWLPGQTTVFAQTLQLPATLATGTYHYLVKLADPSGNTAYSVRLASDVPGATAGFNTVTGRNDLRVSFTVP
jgi:hypothetical protein